MYKLVCLLAAAAHWGRRSGLLSLFLLLLLAALPGRAQQNVGIGTTTPNAKAALDISSTDKGLLIPRLTQAQRTAIGSPPDGLMIFQTDGTTGFWYYFSGAWVNIPNANTAGDNLGNHTATQNLNLGANQLVGNGGTSGLSITSAGSVVLSTENTGLLVDASLTTPRVGLMKYTGREGGIWRTSTQKFEIGRVNTSSLLTTPSSYTVDLLISGAGLVGINNSSPAAKLDIQGGADSGGANDPFALAFSWRNGGYRHWLRSRHNSTPAGSGNAIDFYLNNSGTSAGSSAPGTGNIIGLTIDNNNGSPRVGIGTTTPGATLEISGSTSTVKMGGLAGSGTRVVTADASGNLSTVTTSSLGDNLGNHTATTNLNLGANRLVGNSGSSGIYLTSTGQVAVGSITTTGGNAQLANTTTNTLGSDANGGNNSGGVGSLNWAMSNNGYTGMIYNGSTASNANGLAVKIDGTNSNATVLDVSKGAQATAGTSLLTVKASGNVGIGTNAPTEKLSVSGNAVVRDTMTAAVFRLPYTNASDDKGPVITSRVIPQTQGNVQAVPADQSRPTEMILFHSNDGNTNNGGSDQITLRAPQLNFQTYNNTTVNNINDDNGYNERMTIDPDGVVKISNLAGTGTRMVMADATGNLSTASVPTDAQQLSISGGTISLTNGGSVTLPDADATNELQTISKSGSTVTLSNGGGSVTDSDNQNLSLSGAALSISGGTGVTLPDADATNELQTISKSGSTVTLSNGGGAFTDDDNQALSISGSTISLTNGGSVTVPSSADNLGNHTATQNLNLGTNQLVGNGGTQGLTITNAGAIGVGSGLTTPADGGAQLANTSVNMLGSDGQGGYFSSGTGSLQWGISGPGYAALIYNGSPAANGDGLAVKIGGTNSSATAFDVSKGAQGTAGTALFSVKGDGKVGIGTSSPGATLEVSGATSTVKLGGLAGTGTRVVTADAAGNLSTATVPTSESTTASNGLTLSGSDVRLGGALTSATTIGTTAANTLTVNGVGAVSLGTGTGATTLGNSTGTTTISGSAIGLTGGTNINVNSGSATNINTGTSTGVTNIGTGQGLVNLGNTNAATTISGSSIALTGTTSINASGTANTSIGTGAIAGAVTIGRSGSVVTLSNLTGSGTRVVTADASGNLSTVTTASLADNLGNHTATQKLDLSTNQLVGNGGTSGLGISSGGQVGLGGITPSLGQLSNTTTNVIASDGNGVNFTSGVGSLLWAMNTNGYVGAFYNNSSLSNGHGLAVKINGTNSSASILDLSTGTSQNTAGTSRLVVKADGKVGIGVSSPNSTLQVSGTTAFTPTNGIAGGASGSPVALSSTTATYLGLAPGGAGTQYYQLPDPSTCSGRMYVIRNNSAANTAILSTAGGSLYNGSGSSSFATYTLNTNAAGKTIIVFSDGSNWTIGQLN